MKKYNKKGGKMRKIWLLEKAVGCKSMCESIVCYQSANSPEGYLKNNQRYLGEYVEALGEDVVLAILKDVVDNVAEIIPDTYTDSEGCTYNTISFKDGYIRARDLEKGMYDMWDKVVGDKKN